jgi:hypothetical protein
MAEQPAKGGRFKAEMPQIPGLSERPAPAPEAEGEPQPSTMRFVGPVAAAVLLVGLTAWFVWHRPRPADVNASASSGSQESSASPAPLTRTTPPVTRGSGSVVIGSLDDLAAPWSSKAFTFHKRSSSESVEAIAVRLPGPAARTESYWAFSLEEPFGKCRLEYLADLAKLSSQYGYTSNHPLVANPCSGTLYDPLKLGSIPGGAWGRGEIVQGGGFRPPIAIELRIQGNQLIAIQIE